MKNKLILKSAVFSVFIYILVLASCGGGGGGGASLPDSQYSTHNPGGWGANGGSSGGSSSGGSGGNNTISGGTPLTVTGYTYNGQTYPIVEALRDAIATDAFPYGTSSVDFTCTTAGGSTETRTARITKTADGNNTNISIEHQYKATTTVNGTDITIPFYKNDGISLADIIAQSGLSPQTVGNVTFPLESIVIDGQSYSTGSTITANGDISFSTITGTFAKWGIDSSGNIEFSSALQDGETVVINAQNIAKINLPTDRTVTLDLRNASMQGNTIGSTFFQTDPAQARNSLTGIMLPDNLQTIDDQAFENCTNLSAITIPDSVTSIGSMAFESCEALETIIIPSGVTSVGSGAFEDCTGLLSVTISSGVGTIGQSAFNGCTHLTTLNIGSVNAIEAYAFSEVGANSPEGVSVTFENPSVLQTIGNYAFSSGKLNGNVDLPASVTTIGNSAFDSCSGLTSIRMDSVTTIGSYAFNYCQNLTSVNMGNVQTIEERAFLNCTELKRINSNTDNIINLPNTLQSIGEYCFAQSFADTPAPDEFTLVLPNNNNFEIGVSAFYFCTNITTIKAQNANFNNGCTTNANYSTFFSSCTRIKTLDLRACSNITINSLMLQDTNERVTILTGNYSDDKTITVTDDGNTFAKTPLFQGCDENGNLVANDSGIPHFNNSYTWNVTGTKWGNKDLYWYHDEYMGYMKYTGTTTIAGETRPSYNDNQTWPPAGE